MPEAYHSGRQQCPVPTLLDKASDFHDLVNHVANLSMELDTRIRVAEGDRGEYVQSVKLKDGKSREEHTKDGTSKKGGLRHVTSAKMRGSPLCSRGRFCKRFIATLGGRLN